MSVPDAGVDSRRPNADYTHLTIDSLKVKQMFQLSAKTEYGCVAMLSLATAYEKGGTVRVRAIAEAHNIPSGFLTQILLQLKAAGLVTSTRGAAGGYRMAGSPESVTIADVVGALGGQLDPPSHATNSSSAASKVLADLWREFLQEQRTWMEHTDFGQLVDQLPTTSTQMYYI